MCHLQESGECAGCIAIPPANEDRGDSAVPAVEAVHGDTVLAPSRDDEALRQQRWQESFALTNARVQYSPSSQNWRLSAFGTNLRDERYLNSGFLSGGFGIQAATVNRPREVGATLEFFFE